MLCYILLAINLFTLNSEEMSILQQKAYTFLSFVLKGHAYYEVSLN